jgi:tryptophan synthase alpha chain
MSLAKLLSARGRCGFVPFLTAGDPSLAATERHARALAEAGADVLELGVPFSDPVADGPVISAAATRAVKKGITLTDVIGLARRVPMPAILFTYLNPVLSLGYEEFAKRCCMAVSGVLVVDLPAEESGPLSKALKKHGVELVLLASPTTSDARLRLIGRLTGSILYYVSREGVTGARAGLASNIARRLKHVRRLTKKPLIVGFGVATPQQAKALSRHAAGVVVGSALVAEAAKGKNPARLAQRIIGGLK